MRILHHLGTLKKRLIEVKLTLEVEGWSSCPLSVFSNHLLSSLAVNFILLLLCCWLQCELNLIDRAVLEETKSHLICR